MKYFWKGRKEALNLQKISEPSGEESYLILFLTLTIICHQVFY